MGRPSGLGKGLSSLIPPGESSASDAADSVLQDIPVSSVSPNPHQPRSHFDEASLAELTASIQQIGVLQPILVRRRDDDGNYELVAGERRWRAAQRAGLATIPAVVRTTDDLSSIEQALVENLHRQDLTALEEAAAYQQLIEDFDFTHEEVADRVGKSRSAVSNTLRLLGLPPSIQHLLAEGSLSAGHARALLRLPDRSRQEEVARLTVEEGWSVRMIEDEIRPADEREPVATPSSASTEPRHDGAGVVASTRLRPPGLLELEQLLADHLDTRVKVAMGAAKGKITIDFADLDDLERIYRRMTAD
ncbi:MAG: chromosome partitioning protein ParB [Ilumatobacter coccineus]|uniref:Chromosome partitioning protein ParB n=1 Tax=Ilumatobacter coccineus TaxID=467094 RepID=A0A2G6K769_9ACTN|nr:MAG: chromosome partitioning protein ParB [Ilumatobacter coccineus]